MTRHGTAVLSFFLCSLAAHWAWAQEEQAADRTVDDADEATASDADPSVENAPAPHAGTTGDADQSEDDAEDAPPPHAKRTAGDAVDDNETTGAVDDNEAAAREAFHQGDQLYLEGDYQGAVKAFEKAYALSGRIEMLFNLANAHERLDHYPEAAVALRGYIPHAPSGQRAALGRRLERLERLAQQERKASPPAVTPAPPRPEHETIPVQRAVGIGLVGVGVTGAALGTGFAISAANTRSELDQQCQPGTSGRLCPSAAQPLLDRDQTHSLVADISFAAGAIAAASGIVLILRSHEQERPELQTRLGPGALFVEGRF